MATLTVYDETGGEVGTYDIDTEQERFMHPDLNNNRMMNALMYWNRSKVLDRLARLVNDCTVYRYCDWVQNYGDEVSRRSHEPTVVR